MALSRREYELLRDRVSKLESQVRGLEEKTKVLESRIKGEALLRNLREAEDQEKQKKEKDRLI